jgi:hypothetical protein
LQNISTDVQTTIIINHHTTDVATAASTSQDILGTERQEERDITSVAMVPILISVGAVVGAVILLSAISVLMLIIAYLVWKLKKKDSGNGREMGSSTAEKTDIVDIEADTNPSYIALVTQITTENNVAYGEVTVNQDGDGLYEIMDPPIEDSTAQLTHVEQSGEYTTEYDYVN